VEAVAEGHDDARLQAAHQQSEFFEGEPTVIGRDELALAGGGGAFFEVQIGDDDHALGGPVQGARGVEVEHVGVQVEGGGVHEDSRLKESKRFFFEKKNQKTFDLWAAAKPRKAGIFD